MNEQEYNQLVEKIGKEAADKIKAEFEKLKSSLVTTEQVTKTVTDALAELKLDGDKIMIEGKSLTSVLKEQGEALAAKDQGTPIGGSSIAKTMKDAIDADKEGYSQATRKQGSAWFGFEHKDAGNITRTTVPTAPSNFVPSQELRPGVIPYRTNTPIMMQISSVTNTTKGVINWVDETAGEGDAGWTAEGNAKPLLDVNVTVRNTTVKKVAVFSKVSEEALDDIDFLAGLIEGRQTNKLVLKMDDGLINGDGTGETPTGIKYYAPGFTSTEMNDSVVNPNYFDALGAAATQIRRANFEPTAVLINPVDWFKMMHTKDAEERYVLLSLQMANGAFLEMTAIKSNQVTVGEFLMGDFRYNNIVIRENRRTEMGLDGNDFRNNVVSMRTEARLAAYVSENEKLAFCIDQYQDVMDAIENTEVVQP